MQNNGNLKHQAVIAAKNGEWPLAIELNQKILAAYPASVDALNRLGIAYTQINQLDKAKRSFEKALSLDKTNSIARKNLDKLSENTVPTPPTFGSQHFIEEPGKTKLVNLHRLAGKDVLETLPVGELCTLKPKKRYISVEVNNTYIGALPDDLSYRISKLISSGNQYACYVRSSSAKHCTVYLKETNKSKRNSSTQSFPATKSNSSIENINEPDIIREKIPFESIPNKDAAFVKQADTQSTVVT